MIDWKKYKSANPTMKPNKMLIPVNNFGFNEEGIKEFNEIYQYCWEQVKSGNFNEFVKTASGGISIARGNIRGPMAIVSHTKTIIEILIRNLDARYYRFIIGYNKDKDNESKLFGRQAFALYKEELLKTGIDIEDYAITNGEEVKKTIPKPKIECVATPGRTYYNAHHIDINSAYNAGIAEAFPTFRPAIEHMYQQRKIKPEYKQVLNMAQGFMQSELVGYRFSHISKAGHMFTHRTLEELTEVLVSSGRRILGYNTDGIWYQGDILESTDETSLGKWKTDHKNCKLRFKSAGCYEFIENDIYTPVFRGESCYERIKPREEWEWGDIFKGEAIEYKFVEGRGIIYVNN